MGVNNIIDITTGQQEIIVRLLERYLPDVSVWVYGSRINGKSRPQSDLDMVVFAKSEQELQVFDLKEAFEESNLPFRVDLFIWDDVPEKFKENIKKEHVILKE